MERIAVGLVLALVIEAPLIVHAVWCAILKDGSPLRRDWWSS